MNKTLQSSLVALPAALLFFSCAVGPNFKAPAPPAVTNYTTTAITNTSSVTNVAGGEEQRFIEGLDISGEWWTLFHSKALNGLIGRALTNNPNIKSAQAALRLAQENRVAQQGTYWPAITGSFSASRNKTSEYLAPIPNANAFYYSLYTPQLAVSYEPDVFGLNRRTVESLKAQEDQQRFALIATHIALSANVVSAAIQEASLRAQVAATRRLIGFNSNALEVLRLQFSKGYTSRLDVAAQESQLAQVEATLPSLLKQLAQQRDALAVLVGAFPSEEIPETFELTDLQLPREIPLSLPSKLVEQRPDIRQAAENMHSASAQVGVAIANRIPNITLSADIGSSALSIDKLFSSGTGFWTLGGAVTQPLFEGGMLLHKQRAAQAALTQAAEQYKATVQTAFQNVADALNALDQDANALKAAVNAEHAAKVTFEVSQKQYQAGYANYLFLLTAEQTYQQAIINLVQAQANRYSDTAALFLALGGGWWNSPDLPKG